MTEKALQTIHKKHSRNVRFCWSLVAISFSRRETPNKTKQDRGSLSAVCSFLHYRCDHTFGGDNKSNSCFPDSFSQSWLTAAAHWTRKKHVSETTVLSHQKPRETSSVTTLTNTTVPSRVTRQAEAVITLIPPPVPPVSCSRPLHLCCIMCWKLHRKALKLLSGLHLLQKHTEGGGKGRAVRFYNPAIKNISFRSEMRKKVGSREPVTELTAEPFQLANMRTRKSSKVFQY